MHVRCVDLHRILGVFTPSVRLVDVALLEFGVPETRPEISAGLHADQMSHLRERTKAAALATLVVYADREHFANVAYVIEFEPRFEEALLIQRMPTQANRTTTSLRIGAE